MFGIGPTELALFLVILLLVVGPDRLPTFMRTVGRGVRQVRGASREFKDAIGFDELMREGDPFRPPKVRQPAARPVPIEEASAQRRTTPPPIPPEAASVPPKAPVEEAAELEPEGEKNPAEAKHP